MIPCRLYNAGNPPELPPNFTVTLDDKGPWHLPLRVKRLDLQWKTNWWVAFVTAYVSRESRAAASWPLPLSRSSETADYRDRATPI